VKLESAEVIEPTVAVTSTSPGPLAAGTKAVQVVADEQLTELAAVEPKLKVVAPAVVEKPDPDTVTCTNPVMGARSGVMALMAGTTTSMVSEAPAASISQAEKVSPYGVPKAAPPLVEPTGAVTGTAIELVPLLVMVTMPPELLALTVPAVLAAAHVACSLRI
jgi:hypothetical protein